MLTVVVLGVIGLLVWNAYFRPYHGPTVEDFENQISEAITCERLYPIRREIDAATQEEGGFTELEWQRLQDQIAMKATALRPTMEAGESQGLCADLIVPCLPRGAVCSVEP